MTTSLPRPNPAAGNTLAPETLLSSGQYKIDRLLGSGGFGNTYLALDSKLHGRVAIKEYLPSQLGTRYHDGTVGPTSPRFKRNYDAGLRQFRKEAGILLNFQHPQIVGVMNAFEAFGTAYMVMNYVAGSTLADVLKLDDRDQPTANTTPLNYEHVLAMLSRLLDGLQAVHERGILHRDLKPSNVMLRKHHHDSRVLYDSPVLIDFGAAQDMLAGSALAVVSEGYSPLEQHADTRDPLGPQTDFYALGATIHVALTGSVPAPAPIRVLEGWDWPPLEQTPSRALRKDLRPAVRRMLALRPAERPQDTQEVRKLLPIRGPWWSPGRVAAVLGLLTVALLILRPIVIPPPPPPRVECPQVNDEGESRLHEAAERNDTGGIRNLANQNCDLDQRDDLGETPLHEAVFYGQEEATRTLLELGADPRRKTDNGNTPLHYAGRRDGRFVDGRSVSEALAVQVAVALLERPGVEVDDPREDGRTPLHVAASTGRPGVVRALLNRGADVQAVEDINDWTALHLAHFASRSYPQACEIVESLLDVGADPFAIDRLGRIPADLGGERGCPLE